MSDARRGSRNGRPGSSERGDEKITVRVPAVLLSRVDHAALGRGVGRSEFVRQALATHTDAVLGAAADGGGPTLYDVLAADGVVGRFTGPRGLSTAGRTTIRERVRARAVTGHMTGVRTAPRERRANAKTAG